MDAEDDLSGVVSPPVPAPAPPRPPNPELVRLQNTVHARLASELASLTQAMALDAERLRAHQTDLLAGEPALRDEMARLEAVRDVCTGVARRVRSVVEDAERNVAELKRKGDPAVDELVCSTTIVHNQCVPQIFFSCLDAAGPNFSPRRAMIFVSDCRLINLVAEDNAIEDTMYHLHRALNAGRIDLERFLRVRRAHMRRTTRVLTARHRPAILTFLDYARSRGGTVFETGLNREDSVRDTDGRICPFHAPRTVDLGSTWLSHWFLFPTPRRGQIRRGPGPLSLGIYIRSYQPNQLTAR